MRNTLLTYFSKGGGRLAKWISKFKVAGRFVPWLNYAMWAWTFYDIFKDVSDNDEDAGTLSHTPPASVIAALMIADLSSAECLIHTFSALGSALLDTNPVTALHYLAISDYLSHVQSGSSLLYSDSDISSDAAEMKADTNMAALLPYADSELSEEAIAELGQVDTFARKVLDYTNHYLKIVSEVANSKE